MALTRSLRLGIYHDDFNKETIEKMLKSLKLPYVSHIFRYLDTETGRLLDTLMLINPVLSADQLQALETCVRDGTTAMILVSGEANAHAGTLPLLDELGIKLTRIEQTKRLNITYTQDYPVVHKRNKKDTIISKEKQEYILFSLLDKGPTDKKPIIVSKRLFSQSCYAAAISFGRGTIIVSNSFGFRDDRAELIGHLLQQAYTKKVDFFPAVIEKLTGEVLTATLNAFEVYDEVPMGLIAQRAGVTDLIAQEFDLRHTLENFIRSGHIPAKIHGSMLVKKNP